MKVLWITNDIMPEVAQYLKLMRYGSGGWMQAMLSVMRNAPNIHLAVASVSKYVSKLTQTQINGIDYFVLPKGKVDYLYDKNLETQWLHIRQQFNPDIVHIHGTEFVYGLAYIRACGGRNVVVSLQGLISEIAKVYLAAIPDNIIWQYTSIAERIFHRTLFDQQKHYQCRGEFEKEYLRTIKYCIGRTDWDKNVVMSINPAIHYFSNNENLNTIFYEKEWQYEKCLPYSIVVSQCSYPIKGFHILLQALPLILSRFPDTKVFVAGANNISHRSIKRKLLPDTYISYLSALIKQNNLEEHIVFTGALSPEIMCELYLKGNVYVLCSAIENSSNSLGEAQLIGMPTIVSDVAGNRTMTDNGKLSKMYPFADWQKLADSICEVFAVADAVDKRFLLAQKVANQRHDPKTNLSRLLSIYNYIADEN